MPHPVDPGLSAALRPAAAAIARSVPASSAERARAISPSRAVGHLQLTGEAAGLQALQRKLSAAPAVDAARVDSVRAALADGSYRVRAEVIAARMLELDRQLGA